MDWFSYKKNKYRELEESLGDNLYIFRQLAVKNQERIREQVLQPFSKQMDKLGFLDLKSSAIAKLYSSTNGKYMPLKTS